MYISYAKFMEFIEVGNFFDSHMIDALCDVELKLLGLLIVRLAKNNAGYLCPSYEISLKQVY